MSGITEEIRKLTERVELERRREQAKVYLLTSPVGGEGVSHISRLFIDELTHTHARKVFLLEVPDSVEGDPLPDTLQADFFEKLRTEYDVVVVDAGGLLEKSGTLSYIDCCDAAILILQADCTTREQSHRTVMQLKQYGVRMLGLILNGSTDPVPGWIKRKMGL